MLFPNVMWAFLLNGVTLGINIAMGTTYGKIITDAPYSFGDNQASYVTVSQIVTALVALPMLGNGSDWIMRWKARRNGGIHEVRLREKQCYVRYSDNLPAGKPYSATWYSHRRWSNLGRSLRSSWGASQCEYTFLISALLEWLTDCPLERTTIGSPSCSPTLATTLAS